jgi:hypothetical protein
MCSVKRLKQGVPGIVASKRSKGPAPVSVMVILHPGFMREIKHEHCGHLVQTLIGRVMRTVKVIIS